MIQTHPHLDQSVRVRFGEERDCKSLCPFFDHLDPWHPGLGLACHMNVFYHQTCLRQHHSVVNCLKGRRLVADLKMFHP